MMTMFWSQFLYQIPALLTYLVGIVVALALWRRSPGAFLFAVIGLGILFVQGLTHPVINAICYAQIDRAGWTPTKYGQVMGVVGIIRAAIYVVGFVFVLLAVFSGRPARPANEPPPL